MAVAWTDVMRGLVVLGLLLGWLATWGIAAKVHAPPDEETGDGKEREEPTGAGRPTAPEGAGRTAGEGEAVAPAGDAVERPGTVICCSGGGIRAASFALGGLQALGQRYADAYAVVGVSGGGYVAAAHHVLRWQSGPGDDEAWADLDPPAYTRDSPEEKWLRRHSRYLLDSTRVGVIAVLSLLFGVAVNLLFLVVLIGAAAWLGAWFMLASGGFSDWSFHPRAVDYRGDWAWLDHSWIVLAVGLGQFVVAKFADKWGTWLDVRARDWVRHCIAWLVAVGLLVLGLTHALPFLLVGLHEVARADHGSTLLDAVGTLLNTLGFASVTPREAVEGAAHSGGSRVSGVSLAAIAAAVIATVRALGWTLAVGGKEQGSALGRLLSRVWGKVKSVVLPWAAAIVVVLLLVVLFLTWTVALLNDSGDLAWWALPQWIAVALALVLVITDANRTSLHHFYRERLSSAYLVQRGPDGRPQPINYRKPLRFSEATPRPPGGGPRLITCAVANVNDSEVVPTDRSCTPFVFSHDRIGLSEEILPSEALVPSRAYEFAADSRWRDATIPAAMAISGAAFSPLAGRENVRLAPYRLVLALANARLGVWLPNPLWVDAERVGARVRRAEESPWRRILELGHSMATKPSPLLVAWEAFGRTSVLDRFLYVTDGGHYDNLGLVEALRHEPERVVVLDASNDPEDTFRAFGQAVATARMDLGCDIDLDPRSMRTVEGARAPAAWGHGTVRYRRRVDGSRLTGQLWLAKAIMVDDLPWDIETYQRQNPQFPRTSTSRQFYGEFDLEAYRALGVQIVRQMVADE